MEIRIWEPASAAAAFCRLYWGESHFVADRNTCIHSLPLIEEMTKWMLASLVLA